MDRVLVLDFGGQYSQLIARRIREVHVYAEVVAYDRITPGEIAEAGYRGIILTGGPASVHDKASPRCDRAVLKLGLPVLGICYGEQLMAYLEGGTVSAAERAAEYGKTLLMTDPDPVFADVPAESICWMSHMDHVTALPEGFFRIARTEHCPNAAFRDAAGMLYGLQFHPEVSHTAYGTQILKNFVFSVCGCKDDWKVEDFIRETERELREDLRGEKVLIALSGGVDSAVAAALLHRAVGSDLRCVFVDNGLLRKNEADSVEQAMRSEVGIDLIRVNAGNRFLARLKGVTNPETKRKVIGEEFVRVFEEEASKLGEIRVLAQGTIYPDVIESGGGAAAAIKSHHNVGGLPASVGFKKIVEPLRSLFKDEVRRAGRELGIPDRIVMRQPFPGPGLAIRVIGEVTEEKLGILREADAIFREEMERAGLENIADQYFAVLTDVRSVGVMGDARTYGYTVALRAVTTEDFMTAEWARIPYAVLESAGHRITNELQGVSRVVYDITSKPPATVEWE